MIVNLLPAEEAKQIVIEVSTMQWPEGLARTKELTGTVKQNREILSSDKGANPILTLISKRIMQSQAIGLDCIPYKIHPPKFSKYSDGGQYQNHTDAPWMLDTRTDISCTIWLSDPDSYEGGILYIDGKGYKGKPGQAIFYDCGAVHSVTPVTKGERICAVTWIQSRIRDPIKRKMISDFRKWLAKMEGTENFAEGSVIYSALLKRWME